MTSFNPRKAAALLAVLLGACASTTPAPVLLTLPPALGAATPVAVAPENAASAPLLAVRRVSIPEYLVSRRVRYRADAATLAEWPNTYWAERIEIGVSREFVAALRQQLPGWSLCAADCGDLSPALSLQVDLLPLDYLRASRTLQAHARITVSTAAAAPRVLQVLERSYTLTGADDSAQAQALAMAELLRQVAAAAAPLVVAAPR